MRFVVRQPIFDEGEQVDGYLLKIEKGKGAATDAAEELAPVTVALERIPPHAWAMVECGAGLLASEAVRSLPPQRVVLALSADEDAPEEMLHWVRVLRRAGYTFAVLQYEAECGWEPFLPYADWVGIRIGTGAEVMQRSMAAVKSCGGRLIASDVATRSNREAAQRQGFHYFEGAYYLTASQELPREVAPSRLGCLRLLAELQRPELRHPVLERVLKAEPSFCYRLMRYMNSAAFFGLQKVTSIRHAMTLLGDEQLRRWLSMMAAVEAVDGRPNEVLMCALLRGRLCELLWTDAPDAGFMTGLFSLMPLVVNLRLDALLSIVRLPAPVERALSGERGPLRTLLNLAVAFERAQWHVVHDLAAELRITDDQVFAARGEASRWANEILASQSPACAVAV